MDCALAKRSPSVIDHNDVSEERTVIVYSAPSSRSRHIEGLDRLDSGFRLTLSCPLLLAAAEFRREAIFSGSPRTFEVFLVHVLASEANSQSMADGISSPNNIRHKRSYVTECLIRCLVLIGKLYGSL